MALYTISKATRVALYHINPKVYDTALEGLPGFENPVSEMKTK